MKVNRYNYNRHSLGNAAMYILMSREDLLDLKRY